MSVCREQHQVVPTVCLTMVESVVRPVFDVRLDRRAQVPVVPVTSVPVFLSLESVSEVVESVLACRVVTLLVVGLR